MARQIDQLTEAKIRAITSVGFHPDGRGLYLQVRPGGSRSWIYRFTLAGRTRDMGLGPLTEVSLVAARKRATAARALVAEGIDPIEAARAERARMMPVQATPKPAGLTFQEAAEAYMADKLKRLRNEVHRKQWRYSLETFAYPIIGNMPIAEIGTADVLNVLRPIWERIPETAGRLRGRLERILARAAVEGHRTGANPATWRGHLQEALPARSEVRPVEHHPALHYNEIPSLMAELRSRSDVSSAALRFLVLTAARTGEIIGARWHEIDWNDKVWIVPAERAKAGREHVVPLSIDALQVLEEMKPLRDTSRGFIFPGTKGRGLSQMALLALLQRRMKRPVTVHGFRSGFRDWCGDVAAVPREIAEAALAHVVRDQTERAYRRSTAIERRREVMQIWADYCATVVDFPSSARRATAAG
ncbi:MAG: integrase arm-type DNA-binding domain-containing protein [Nitrobacter sp.]|uniref:tyrosine-type recombinase/integrase n=1 Tax=Nitrobacter sp. TaxID=29420 RepID=UPI00262088B4|nr:integrase arm-type DNA-binding domain-containing protein [Nitrobacter sp.]MCV0387400.1 integrase arm-type DNA-binding domain-containing protein [Nitrobacter sp.]